ncbi:hypothetical protein HII31_07768 [Pseudocercospora fuligena]|uniref:NTF2-like domain-containing protein n=1 Tax=Pseudocercospora fuligena TaxID=685502 RepID=A0A8H6RGM8_9PEZI|nr:hypothetical protein HII31_07768 [Pseudocercospora fuligena]
MHLKFAASFLAIASIVTATALPGSDYEGKGHGSNDKITQAEAERFVNRFFRFMQTGDRDLAEELLTPDVKGYSASTFSINGFDPPVSHSLSITAPN